MHPHAADNAERTAGHVGRIFPKAVRLWHKLENRQLGGADHKAVAKRQGKLAAVNSEALKA